MTNKTCSPSVFFKCTYIRSFVVFRITLIVCHYPWFVWKQENYLTSPLDSLGCLTGPCLKHCTWSAQQNISHYWLYIFQSSWCFFFFSPNCVEFRKRLHIQTSRPEIQKQTTHTPHRPLLLRLYRYPLPRPTLPPRQSPMGRQTGTRKRR